LNFGTEHGKITLQFWQEVPDMKVFMILIVMVVPVMAGTILYEYFTSTTFPPTNWTVNITGTGGSWSWSNANPTDGGYAHGVVSLSGAGTGSATLKTPPFSLTAGDMCNTCLSIRMTKTGSLTTYSWQLVLFNGTTEVTVSNLDESSTWFPTCCAFLDITTTSSDYAVGWRVNATGPGGSSATFDVDTVHITEDGLAVEPASLGRIKGVFH
jgi:hypothetical protein